MWPVGLLLASLQLALGNMYICVDTWLFGANTNNPAVKSVLMQIFKANVDLTYFLNKPAYVHLKSKMESNI